MLTPDLKAKIEALAGLIRASDATGAFTGAGISTESGIPDFRGPNGIWKKIKPTDFADFVSDPQVRLQSWRRSISGYPRMRDAQPNEGHRALARLYDAGFLKTVITQNIDSV